MPLVLDRVLEAFRSAGRVAAVSTLRARSDLRSLGNDGAVGNVRSHLAAAAEASAEVDRLVWRLAVAERARVGAETRSAESLAPTAA